MEINESNIKKLISEQKKAICYLEYAIKFHLQHLKETDFNNPVERIRLLTNSKRALTYVKRGYSLLLMINEAPANVESIKSNFFRNHLISNTIIIGNADGNMLSVISDLTDKLKDYKLMLNLKIN